MRILIVDDEPSIVELLVRICSGDGHDTVGHTTSADAIDHMTKHAVDLLITDVIMPAPDGLQVIKEGRAVQPNLMSIAMTGHIGQYRLSDVQAVGATDLIYKPLRLDEIRARIGFAEQRRRLIQGMNARRRELQQMSADMLKALQEELEEARRGSRGDVKPF